MSACVQAQVPICVYTCTCTCLWIKWQRCACTVSQDTEDKRYLWLPSMDDSIRPAICVVRAWRKTPTLPVTPAQLMRPGIGRNASCALGDCLTARP